MGSYIHVRKYRSILRREVFEFEVRMIIEQETMQNSGALMKQLRPFSANFLHMDGFLNFIYIFTIILFMQPVLIF